MLVKLTCRGRDYPAAVARARRALAEFRIRGVSTNISFLQAVLDDPDFVAGDVATSFIDERPELLKARVSADRGTKLLTWLADVTVNKPNGELPVPHGPGGQAVPALAMSADRPGRGSRQRLLELGPEGFAAALRAQNAVAVTDTTFRDAHQSLLATRVRTRDLRGGRHRPCPRCSRSCSRSRPGAGRPTTSRCASSAKTRGTGWPRCARRMPNLCLQMLLRGRNTVGYTPYPEEVTVAFVNEAAATGIDIFRIFDALNDVNQMAPAIRAVRETGTAVAEVALCYTADMLDPAETLYTLDYYLELAQKIVDAGAHILAIKDMAGLLRPAAAARLVSALRERFDLPVHLHTHDTAGGQLATLLAAVDAGVDAVDVASASLAGTTSQPSASALVAALAHTPRDTGLSLANVCALEPYWEAVRRVYAPFESGLPGPTGRVYQHEIPGGQLSNLRQQAMALGLGERFEAIEDMYTAADRILGRLVKVTPSSKVVGDLALHLVGLNADPADFNENPQKYDVPDSVIGFLSGELGDPPGGWPEPFRTKALQGRTVKVRDVELSAEDSAALQGDSKTRRRTLNRLLFAGPTKDYQKSVESYGNLSVLDTRDYLFGLQRGAEHEIELEKGVRLIASLEAVSEPDEKGMRTVMCTLNGQSRPVVVRDRSVVSNVKAAERADASQPGQVAAPFAGAVTLTVKTGDTVKAGDTVATIEAMKMEASITTPVAGTVARLAVGAIEQVQGGDLLLVVE